MKERSTKDGQNFGTGAAITAVPKSLEEQRLVEGDGNGSSMSYRTASEELLGDEGGVLVQGLDKKGLGRSVKGRLVRVRRVLASGIALTKGNAVLLNGSKGWIIPKSEISQLE